MHYDFREIKLDIPFLTKRSLIFYQEGVAVEYPPNSHFTLRNFSDSGIHTTKGILSYDQFNDHNLIVIDITFHNIVYLHDNVEFYYLPLTDFGYTNWLIKGQIEPCIFTDENNLNSKIVFLKTKNKLLALILSHRYITIFKNLFSSLKNLYLRAFPKNISTEFKYYNAAKPKVAYNRIPNLPFSFYLYDNVLKTSNHLGNYLDFAILMCKYIDLENHCIDDLKISITKGTLNNMIFNSNWASGYIVKIKSNMSYPSNNEKAIFIRNLNDLIDTDLCVLCTETYSFCRFFIYFTEDEFFRFKLLQDKIEYDCLDLYNFFQIKFDYTVLDFKETTV